MKTVTKILCSGALALTMSACSSLGGQSQRVYVLPSLTPVATMASDPIKNLDTLIVAQPQSSDFLNSVRIAVQKNQELMVYAGIRWDDSLPSIVQSRMIQDLQRSGLFKAVLDDQVTVQTRYTLQTHIKQYQLDLSSNPRVKVAITATLILTKNNQAVANQSFLVSLPANSKNPNELVHDFAKAQSNIDQLLISWLEQEIK